MLYWIFDLDYTLYQLPSNIRFDYNLLKKDNQLKYLLSMLPCYKIIYTNGTYGHAVTSTEIMGIKENFHKMVGRDNLNYMKPSLKSFTQFNKLVKIKQNDKCVFFEDSIENLITAKNLGWITVYIGPNKVLSDDIDFWFPNIHVALNFFVNKIHNRYKKTFRFM
jgi:FMN phosphatase YigB (HAD superfamily)